jgi:hypothetical protein
MADGITRIAVEGFKSIATRQEIEIRPLTILAGANSSGKSSIMQPLLMLKQTLEATYDPGPLKLDGPNVKFTSSEQFFAKEGMKDGVRIGISFGNLEFEVYFHRPFPGSLKAERNTFRVQNHELILRPGMSPQELSNAMASFPLTKEFAHFDDFGVRSNRFLLQIKNAPFAFITLMFDMLTPRIQDIVHVPGMRGNPSRTYQVTAAGPDFPGTFEHYVASVISRWQSNDLTRYRSLSEDLEIAGLTQGVSTRMLNETEIELQVNRVRNGSPDDLVNIADVGSGVSQALPVLVALRVAEEGRLVYLEEPEIHLHPRAQTRLAEVLASAAKRGVRVVAETHSSLLLTAIQTLVAKGDLPPDLVKLHWFQRDPETGNTQISSADLDENGAFGDWPEDFGAVALDAEGGYLDAVEGRQVS